MNLCEDRLESLKWFHSGGKGKLLKMRRKPIGLTGDGVPRRSDESSWPVECDKLGLLGLSQLLASGSYELARLHSRTKAQEHNDDERTTNHGKRWKADEVKQMENREERRRLASSALVAKTLDLLSSMPQPLR